MSVLSSRWILHPSVSFLIHKGDNKMQKSVEQQVQAIQGILNKSPTIPDYRFTFGMHEGKTLKYVYENNPRYLKWLYQEGAKLPKKVEAFISQL